MHHSFCLSAIPLIVILILSTEAGILTSNARHNLLRDDPNVDLRFGLELLNASTRIIGGSDAGIYEFPWQVSIQLRHSEGATPFCGGAIISPNKILTAGHCIFEEDTSSIDVVAGVHNIFNPDGTEQRIRISNAVYHDDFDINTFNNDIAVLTLSRNLVYNSRVQPVPLPRSGSEASGACQNSGWGNVRNDGGIEYPENLQKVTLQIVNREVCRDNYDGMNLVTDGMICAGDEINKGSCKGDSGGPLVCQGSLSGIVSWGTYPCAIDPLKPSVFANVAYFIDWINAQLLK